MAYADAGEALLGRPVQDVLGRLTAHAIRNAQAQPSIEKRRVNLGHFDCGSGVVDLSMFRSGDFLIVEVIPADDWSVPSAREVLADVSVLSDALVQPEPARSPFTRFVSLLRTISGYNCVAIEQLSEGGSATVEIAGERKFAEGRLVSAPDLWSIHDIGHSTVGLASQDG
ncbi:MAG: hypothetical protein AAFY31_06775, partial [Pseudomonadota bacterium]